LEFQGDFRDRKLGVALKSLTDQGWVVLVQCKAPTAGLIFAREVLPQGELRNKLRALLLIQGHCKPASSAASTERLFRYAT